MFHNPAYRRHDSPRYWLLPTAANTGAYILSCGRTFTSPWDALDVLVDEVFESVEPYLPLEHVLVYQCAEMSMHFLLTPQEIDRIVAHEVAIRQKRARRALLPIPADAPVKRFSLLQQREEATVARNGWDVVLDAGWAVRRFVRDWSDVSTARYRLRNRWQRVTRGWSDENAYNFADTFGRTVPAMLDFLQRQEHYSSPFKDDVDVTPDEWRERLLGDSPWEPHAFGDEFWSEKVPDIIRAFRNWHTFHYGDHEGFCYFNVTDEERERIESDFFEAGKFLLQYIHGLHD